MGATVIEVSLSDLEEGEDERIEQIVDTLANDVVPSLAEAADVQGSAIASRARARICLYCRIYPFDRRGDGRFDLGGSGDTGRAGGCGRCTKRSGKAAISDGSKADLALRPVTSRRTH